MTNEQDRIEDTDKCAGQHDEDEVREIDERLGQIDIHNSDSLWSEDDEFGSELHRIAKLCIKNNWHRTDRSIGGWHRFSDEELAEINERTGNRFDHGYCFLDKAGGSEGMIRLVEGDINPKWSFWMDDDRLIIDIA